MSEKNSKKSTKTSRTSKPSTAQDTNTQPNGENRWLRFAPLRQGVPELDHLFDFYWGGPERRITGLTLRIISVNAIALLMLMLGILYLGKYQNNLIAAKLENFESTVEMIADTLSASGLDQNEITPTDTTQMLIKRLAERGDITIQVFTPEGNRIINSKDLGVQKRPPKPKAQEMTSIRILKSTAAFIIGLVPETRTLPLYPNPSRGVPDIGNALSGQTSLSAWQDESETILLSAAAPLHRGGEILGGVLVTRTAEDITEDLAKVWIDVLRIFLITLIITTALSIYLSGVIASPLRRLAHAAEKIRSGRFQSSDIPDFSDRHDEIGELSFAFKTMTEALWQRMDSIESFAADVSHELKNPLTSLRSAVETFQRIENKADRDKLMKIIQHDIERMDRLITDISTASKLDAALSREAFTRLDLKHILEDLIDTYRSPLSRSGKQGNTITTENNIHITFNHDQYQNFYVMGVETRLTQLFQNLIDNALSFSSDNAAITITLVHEGAKITVSIEDQGPGIPEDKREDIFDRFYSERPESEDYGQHSGLGLSICKQIIDAHDGKIFVQNIKNESGKVQGASFSVVFKTA